MIKTVENVMNCPKRMIGIVEAAFAELTLPVGE
jgi:hypothetical protein